MIRQMYSILTSIDLTLAWEGSLGDLSVYGVILAGDSGDGAWQRGQGVIPRAVHIQAGIT